jgi:hypothetical protein
MPAVRRGAPQRNLVPRILAMGFPTLRDRMTPADAGLVPAPDSGAMGQRVVVCEIAFMQQWRVLSIRERGC